MNHFPGYYRVNYDIDNWSALTKILKNNETLRIIPRIHRAKLISDVSNLAQSTDKEFVPMDIAVELLSYIKNESDILVIYMYALNSPPFYTYMYDHEEFQVFKVSKG